MSTMDARRPSSSSASRKTRCVVFEKGEREKEALLLGRRAREKKVSKEMGARLGGGSD